MGAGTGCCCHAMARMGYQVDAVEPLHLIATDGCANHMRPALEAMDEETYQLYLKYHFATCERMDLLGYSNHTLDIFRKSSTKDKGENQKCK